MKKNKILILILGILLAAAVVVGVIFGVKALLNKNSETPEAASDILTKSAYTVDDISADDPRLDKVVAECGDYQITNRQIQVFYGMQYASFMNSYGDYASYFGLDATKALKDQASMDEGLTWEQYFLKAAVEEFREYAASATEAKAVGYVLPEEEVADLESFLSDMEAQATVYGFESADAYLQDSFGSAVNTADYENYLRTYFQAMSYENSIYLSVEPTDDDLLAYKEEHPDEFTDADLEARSIDVRHILILSDPDEDGEATEEEKANAKAKAEEILAEYLKDPTEEHFADLAMEYSEDPGSKSKGGLYEGISQETNFVEPFKNWCLDSARQAGDTDIVETNYGYHVMYFVGSDLSWKATARHSIRMAHTDAIVKELIEKYSCTVRYEDIVLSPLPMAVTE